MRQVACTTSTSTETNRASETEPLSAAGYDPFACATTPTAYLLAGGDRDHVAGLTEQLKTVGFNVETIALERSPALLRGVIVIPSRASESADYLAYVERFSADLYEFVDNANVLVQLAQRHESEETPAFLPSTHTVTRDQKSALGGVRVKNPEHPLLRDLVLAGDHLPWRLAEVDQPVFIAPKGFEVILSDPRERYSLLIEGAYGQGRFVLSALELELPRDQAEAAISEAFFANLFEHAQAVCGRAAPALALALAASDTAAAFSAGSSMLAVLPDTQVYSLRLPGLYNTQTSFIRMNATRLDIRYVIHLGDIVNNNTRIEWERASAAMSLLHGVVPYALAPGNHDYGPSGDASTRDTHMNEYFSFELSAAMPTFGAAYETGKLDSSYHLFSIQGRDFILLALEWGPRDEVIAWANDVMAQHPEREGILVTHAFLNHNDLRYDHTDTEHPQRHNPHDYATPGGVNDGEELWQKLVRHHRFSITLNGHVIGDGCGYLASTTDRGNVCHQMLSNYQMRNQGGEAYMRLLEFLEDGRTIRVHTYSPLYDGFLDVPGHNFTIVLD